MLRSSASRARQSLQVTHFAKDTQRGVLECGRGLGEKPQRKIPGLQVGSHVSKGLHRRVLARAATCMHVALISLVDECVSQVQNCRWTDSGRAKPVKCHKPHVSASALASVLIMSISFCEVGAELCVRGTPSDFSTTRPPKIWGSSAGLGCHILVKQKSTMCRRSCATLLLGRFGCWAAWCLRRKSVLSLSFMLCCHVFVFAHLARPLV